MSARFCCYIFCKYSTLIKITFFSRIYYSEGNEDMKASAYIRSTDYDRTKQWESLECFNCLYSLIAKYARCTCEIKTRIAMSKAEFSKNENLCTRKSD